MTKYHVIVSSSGKPAGNDDLKTKTATGWDMIWHYGNGVPIRYTDKAKADADAKWLPQPTNGITAARVVAVQS